MQKLKKALALVCAVSMCACTLSACGEKASSDEGSPDTAQEGTESSAGSPAQTDDGIQALFGEIRTEYNTSLDLSDYPLTGSDVPAD